MTASTKNPTGPKFDASTPMDFTTLEAADEKPISTGRGGGDRFAPLEGTKFVEWLQRTKDEEHAMSVVVSTEEQAKRVAYLLRLAAQKSGLGVRIPMKDKKFSKTKDGKFKVLFQGTERRKYDGKRKPVQRNAETDDAFQTRVAAWESETGRSFDGE